MSKYTGMDKQIVEIASGNITDVSDERGAILPNVRQSPTYVNTALTAREGKSRIRNDGIRGSSFCAIDAVSATAST
jgi:hypothetical protein